MVRIRGFGELGPVIVDRIWNRDPGAPKKIGPEESRRPGAAPRRLPRRVGRR